MRKKLVWLLSAVMVVSAVMLGGCGGKKVTAESIIQEVNANMEKCKSFTGDMNMDMTMGMSDGTEEQEISITMGGSLEATTDPCHYAYGCDDGYARHVGGYGCLCPG